MQTIDFHNNKFDNVSAAERRSLSPSVQHCLLNSKLWWCHNWQPGLYQLRLLSLCPPVLNATCKRFTGWLRNPFPTSRPCSQSIRLARIPVFCISICCLLLCFRPEETLRGEEAGNGVVSPLLSPLSEQDRKQPQPNLTSIPSPKTRDNRTSCLHTMQISNHSPK